MPPGGLDRPHREHLVQQRDAVGGIEWTHAGEHLVDDHPHRVHVGREGDRLTENLLRSGVGHGADEQVGIGQARRIAARRDDGETEVDHLVGALAVLVAVPHDVARLEIAVGDAAIVSELQRRGDLAEDGGDARRRHRRLQRDLVGQAGATQQLHDHVGLAEVVDAEIQDADDAGMTQLGRRPALAEEPLVHLLRRTRRLLDHLDGDLVP